MLCQTTVEIRGVCIPTIPPGTQFEVTRWGTIYSNCTGLPVDLIWNDEFEPVMGKDFEI